LDHCTCTGGATGDPKRASDAPEATSGLRLPESRQDDYTGAARGLSNLRRSESVMIESVRTTEGLETAG
jgi:hypothetical protein